MKKLKYSDLLSSDKVPIGTFTIKEIAQNWIELFIYLKKWLCENFYDTKMSYTEKGLLVNIVEHLDSVDKYIKNKDRIKELLIQNNPKFKKEIEDIEKRVGINNMEIYWKMRLSDLCRGFIIEKTIAKAEGFKPYYNEGSPFLDVIYINKKGHYYDFDIKCHYYVEEEKYLTNKYSNRKLYFPYIIWETANKYFKHNQSWLIYKVKELKGKKVDKVYVAVPLAPTSIYEFS